MSTPNPFGHTGPWALSPKDHLVYGWGDSLAVGLYSLAGQRIGGFTHPHSVHPITSSELNTIADEHTEDFKPALRDAARGRWPAFQQLLTDDRGYVWIGVLTPRGQPALWHVFEPNGELICTAPLPELTRVEQIREGRLYGVEEDENDIPRIVVYRVNLPR